jgi:hypothetical protein
VSFVTIFVGAVCFAISFPAIDVSSSRTVPLGHG